MTGIDEVSSTLGKLMAEAEASQRQRTELFNKVDEMATIVQGLNVLLPPLVDKVHTNTRRIEAVEGFKMKVLGVVTGISLGSGFLGAMLTKFGLK